MKRNILIFVGLILAFSLLLTGCDREDSEQDIHNAKNEANAKAFIIEMAKA
ncbi:MAG: hypothetical protein IJX99_03305 [Clostridia bacterium]|nr:hypothetical protein [Clostridia bacterium]